MLDIEPIGGFLGGVLAIALATSVLSAAVVERPPLGFATVSSVVIAGGWSLAFIAAGIVASLGSQPFVLCCLLFAAAELSAAVAVWFARSIPRRPGGWGRRGGGDGPGNPGPAGPADHDQWHFWERDFARRPVARR